jgi:Arc/MetJ family transcription regulator
MAKLNAKQAKEVTAEVGKMLALELDREVVNRKVTKTVKAYIKENKIDTSPEEVAKKIKWSVKVTLQG